MYSTTATIFAALAIAAAAPQTTYAGPFGLDQGMPKGSLDIKAPMQSGIFDLNSVPNPHPDFEAYAATLGDTAGLCRIGAISHAVQNDRYGDNLRALFSNIRNQLDANYGPSRLTDDLGADAIYDEKSEWTMAIHKGERTCRVTWSATGSTSLKSGVRQIVLVTRAGSRDSGNLVLIYRFENEAQCNAEIQDKSGSAL
jgi:hypothetical protein